MERASLIQETPAKTAIVRKAKLAVSLVLAPAPPVVTRCPAPAAGQTAKVRSPGWDIGCTWHRELPNRYLSPGDSGS